MGHTATRRNETKRMDALLDLPLGRFRRALTRLSADELTTLEAHLGVQRMKHRLARGGSGIERHRSPQAMALLARRELALRHEREGRLAARPAPIQLVFPEPEVLKGAAEATEKRAA